MLFGIWFALFSDRRSMKLIIESRCGAWRLEEISNLLDRGSSLNKFMDHTLETPTGLRNKLCMGLLNLKHFSINVLYTFDISK